MSVKIFDTMTTATPNFPLAYAEKINVKLQDGTEDNLQNLFDKKELGGGGDSSVTLTQQEYEALSEEQKLGGLYYTYDTKRIYKNGVQYGASDAEGIGYNNAESGIQATTVQGAIDKVVKTVEDTYAKKTEIPTTLPANGGNADTVNNHTVKSDVPENAVFTDTIYDDTELNAKLNGKADKNAVLKSLEIVNGNVTAQIIPWSDGTHYRGYENKSSNTYTDIITKDGVASIAKIENGVMTKSEELATIDKVASEIEETIDFSTPILEYVATSESSTDVYYYTTTQKTMFVCYVTGINGVPEEGKTDFAYSRIWLSEYNIIICSVYVDGDNSMGMGNSCIIPKGIQLTINLKSRAGQSPIIKAFAVE